jgi:anthraniloyl-CoA monooxygenase
VRVVCLGGGPAGLYFSLLLKKAMPESTIRVLERNRPDDTFGFGVVFSDATLERFARADRPSYDAITRSFRHWDDIDIHYRGEVVRSSGHGFSGLSRQTLLDILQRRAAELGVETCFQHEVTSVEPHLGADLVVACDGVGSVVRSEWSRHFEPSIDLRPNRFVWLGTTLPFDAFTFYFNDTPHGLFQVHAYRYEEGRSTFIVECSAETFERAGLERASEDETRRYCEGVFAEQLRGHPLLTNRSIWRRFPTIRCARWHHENVVLLGDAAHTAHFSIGSGTKLAMDGAIDLAQALEAHGRVGDALAAFEAARRPNVESLQRAAQVSLEWFESTERYLDLDPLTFGFSLLTRSLRVTHENLAKRDKAFVSRVDEAFAEGAAKQSGAPVKAKAPPMFTPLRLRDLVVPNRVVVSPMCQYSAEDGAIGDWHLVHLGSRAIGGAGLVMTEMTDVSAEARITPGCAGLYEPGHVDAWRRVTSFVHRQSAAKIGVQLAHAGRKGSTRPPWQGLDQPLAEGGWEIVAPSPLPYRAYSPTPRAMTRADMDQVKADFVRAAGYAAEAGFDLVELHFAHGYLLGTFLSPLTNQRDDDYGGSLEGRMRYPLEIFAAVRAAWPSERPMSVRISATDWVPGGFAPSDAVVLARALKERGCDVIDVSAGQTVAEQRPIYGRLFQVPFSERVRLEAKIPTIAVGNVSSYTDVNSILAAGRADLVALARAHLFDPYWTRHAAERQGVHVPWPDPYLAVERYSPRFD